MVEALSPVRILPRSIVPLPIWPVILPRIWLPPDMPDRCQIQLAYAIGVAEPVSLYIDTFGEGKMAEAEHGSHSKKRI